MKTAMLSRWHVHADDYVKEALAHPEIDVCAVWDEDAKRGQDWADELGVPFYERLDDLLERTEIEAVIVDTPTVMHKEVIIKAANKGKHIFSEKVLGLSVKECEEIFAAVDAAGVHLMLSLPRLSADYYLYGQKLADEGKLGKLTSFRCRVSHNGAVPTKENPHGWLPEAFLKKEETSGGALIDLGAHPIYLANRFGGKVKEVKALFQTVYKSEVDELAAVLVSYDSGLMAVIETDFVSSGLFHLELRGTEGNYLVEGKKGRMQNAETGGDWIEPELPASAPSAMEQWVNQVKRGAEPLITREDMLRLTEVNERAYRGRE
ncbi:Gfo/Idh/MocA family protein [Jeotgalibacillus aurantiacus]|uniref:Gfo/Idh/MocA family protein n=1 Tax=Jeotgalibacillus aurantiacus TaxID=2763266 RepID=UPI001D0A8C9B|nr:Gfo/Idh/MocA family oxidoreductase [Jeotgalibacillus aurantiacus]